jgi:hypothetical protein
MNKCISISEDGGLTWSLSFIPHRDQILADHGQCEPNENCYDSPGKKSK